MTREQQIVALREQGLTRNQIAQQIGTTRSAVAGVLYRYRQRGCSFAKRQPTAHHEPDVREMRAQNVPCKEIAERLGLKLAQVQNIIKGYGIPPKPGKARR